MAEKGMIVENPLELLPLFEGMQLLQDPRMLRSEPSADEPQEEAVQTLVQPIQNPAESEKEPSPVPSTAVETNPPLTQTRILNLWLDDSKKHWPEEFRAPLTALLSAIKMNGQPVHMQQVQVLNPLVFTDRHGIKEWALSYSPQSILIWGNQTNLDAVPGVFERTDWEGIPVFRLPAFAQVMANIENKKEAWGKLKDFYQF
jgi:hypothetical protein